MNTVEIALAKQRLIDASARQREALCHHAAGLQPLFNAADQVSKGMQLIRRHPAIIAGSVTLLVTIHPKVRRFVWRLGQRAFFAWLWFKRTAPLNTVRLS